MNAEIVTTTSGKYVRVQAAAEPISSEQDMLDLLPYCYEAETSKILLEEGSLGSAFFDLQSGLAGAIFLKLTNYRVKTAIVVKMREIKSKRFQELIWECNKGRQINFFETVPAAEKWLVSK